MLVRIQVCAQLDIVVNFSALEDYPSVYRRFLSLITVNDFMESTYRLTTRRRPSYKTDVNLYDSGC
jgi:hypothetical protein